MHPYIILFSIYMDIYSVYILYTYKFKEFLKKKTIQTFNLSQLSQAKHGTVGLYGLYASLNLRYTRCAPYLSRVILDITKYKPISYET